MQKLVINQWFMMKNFNQIIRLSNYWLKSCQLN